MISDNQVRIYGQLVDMPALRYTPAGIPLVECVLLHESVQSEAGFSRQVNCQIDMIAAGEIAEKLVRCSVPVACTVHGFLAAKNRRNPRLVLHVQHIELDTTN
ncbi:primosomal replication protein N [Aquaspirillum soli]